MIDFRYAAGIALLLAAIGLYGLLAVVAALLGPVALLATNLPSLHATRVNPADALRS